jgi:hypothetical protein
MGQQQNYANHKQIVPIVHYFFVPLGIILIITAIVYAIISIMHGEQIFASLLILVLAFISALSIPLARGFALKVQDRLIRTEEDVRHFKLTGEWLDPRLTIKQIIALRFASEQEFPALCEKAAKENLTPTAIKKAIKDWKGDYYRV